MIRYRLEIEDVLVSQKIISGLCSKSYKHTGGELICRPALFY